MPLKKISKNRGYPFLAIQNIGSHMEILGSDHGVDDAVVTHPYPPRRHRNMLLGSNNTQMNIIEATRGYGWVTAA